MKRKIAASKDVEQTITDLLIWLGTLNDAFETQEERLRELHIPRWELGEARRAANLAYFWYEQFYRGRYT